MPTRTQTFAVYMLTGRGTGDDADLDLVRADSVRFDSHVAAIAYRDRYYRDGNHTVHGAGYRDDVDAIAFR